MNHHHSPPATATQPINHGGEARAVWVGRLTIGYTQRIGGGWGAYDAGTPPTLSGVYPSRQAAEQAVREAAKPTLFDLPA